MNISVDNAVDADSRNKKCALASKRGSTLISRCKFTRGKYFKGKKIIRVDLFEY
jgi:hypothetical protein